jgi:hypothetical protein
VRFVRSGDGFQARKILRVVARYADEWNFSPLQGLGPEGPQEFARLSGVLDEDCGALGRNPEEIRRSIQMLLRPDDRDGLDASLRLLDGFEGAGADHAVLGFAAPPSRALLESLALP